jgi:hypothetical protein
LISSPAGSPICAKALEKPRTCKVGRTRQVHQLQDVSNYWATHCWMHVFGASCSTVSSHSKVTWCHIKTWLDGSCFKWIKLWGTCLWCQIELVPMIGGCIQAPKRG